MLAEKFFLVLETLLSNAADDKRRASDDRSSPVVISPPGLHNPSEPPFGKQVKAAD